jgi:MoaA/NifB/PqqE/SkfB family radical SAM enzyme
MGDSPMLAFRDIPLGRGEESACLRCAGSRPRSSGESIEPEARIDSALDDAPGVGVFFSDVGPLDHPDLSRLAAHAARAGASRIAVRTSGRSLADPGAAARLLESGVRIVEVVFLGSSGRAHDALTGVQGSFQAAAAGVGNLRSAADALRVKVAVRGRVPVCRHNVQDLPATVMHLAESGVSSIVLACDPALDVRRSIDWIAAACDTGTVNRVWVAVSGMDEEVLGDKALHAVDAISFTGASK